MAKRKLDAKVRTELLNDICVGRDDPRLMEKYDLSPVQLVRVLIGLVLKDLLSRDDLTARGPIAKAGTKLGPVLADIRAQMDNGGLMEKYDLTPTLFVRILMGLRSEGLLSDDDLATRGPMAKTENKLVVLADIKGGMDGARLMEKHGLSRRKLTAEICELLSEGELTQEEVARFQY